MIVTSSLTMIGPTIDMIWVGKLGSASIAGVGVAGMAVMLVNSIGMGLFMGMQSLIARSIGSGDTRGAVHSARQAFVISAAYSFLMAAIGILFSEAILKLMGMPQEVIREGTPYLRIQFIGVVTMSFQMITTSIMNASGDSVTPMKISVFYRLFQIALCPFLVFGWGIFPYMGVAGAALSQVVAQFLGMVLGMWVLFTGRSRIKLTLLGFHFDFSLIWRLVRIGIPASVSSIQMSLSQLILLNLIAPFGTFAVAAHTLNQRVESFLFFPPMGIGMAAGVLAAQNLGARRPDRAEKTGWMAAGIVEGFALFGAIIILVWAEGLVHIFSTDPGVVETSTAFLRIAAAGYAVIGMVVSFQSCISGVGDTLPPMIISITVSWIIQLPLAYLLSTHTSLGVYGVRWAMVCGILVGTAAFTIYFKSGRWKRKKI